MRGLALVPLLLAIGLAPALVAKKNSKTSPPPKASTEDRYAYVLGCGATITKLDLTAQKQITQVSLARKTNLIQLTGDAGGSTFDGCATYGLAYTPHGQILYTVSPETGSYRPDGRHFRLLAFHLPDLAFVRSVPLPGTIPEQDEVWLRPELDAHQTLLVRLGPKQALRLTEGKLTPAPAPAAPEFPGFTADPSTGETTLNPSGYRPIAFAVKLDGKRLSCEPQQQSGDTILIRYTGADGQAWAAVQPQARTIVSLNPGFKTTDESFHLAPGGGNILIQEVTGTTAIGLPVIGPGIALLDAATGSILHQGTNPSPTNPKALALSPSGVVILYGRQHFFFLPTAPRFPSEPVQNLHPTNPGSAEYIFADR